MLKDKLETLEKEYEEYLSIIEKFLSSAPEDNIKVIIKNNNEMFYVLKNGKTNGEYIKKMTKEGKELIKLLCQKKYYSKLLPVVSANLSAIKRALSKCSSKSLLSVYQNLPLSFKPYVTPIIQSKEDYAQKWETANYEKAFLEVDDNNFLTKKGEFVRSKSELIIADRLFDHNIPYRYEMVYNIFGHGTFYPDFTILNVRTKKVYVWEHFGLMDNNDYRNKAIKKIGMYTENSSSLGIKFISSFESSTIPLKTQTVDAIIKNNFI